MLKVIQSALRPVFLSVEGVIDRLCGAEANPLYHLGALSWFFFWIVAASGVYLYIPFETSAVGAWQSIEAMTRSPWVVSGIVRSLHRYASDAMVATVLLHILREFALDKYHGARWFAWFSGVPALWLLYVSGITGYWLVWDRMAQYIAVTTSEWLDWFGVFGGTMARNFLSPDALSDRFFTLLMFMHIAVPLFLLFAMWVHILRVNRPAVSPPRVMMALSLAAMLVLAVAKPAVSQAAADLSRALAVLNLDWFFLTFYPLIDLYGPGLVWGLVVAVTVGLAALPWLRRAPRPMAAAVDAANCSGCTRCAVDCPFGAVSMAPRTDGRPFARIAEVAADICTGCGICVGSCPTATPFRHALADLSPGIDLPDHPLDFVQNDMTEKLAALRGEARVVVFGCEHGASLDALADEGVAVLVLPCIGMLPPSFVDFVLGGGAAEGVVLTGCRPGDCFHRLGTQWTEERMAGRRDPYLRDRVPRERVTIHWAGPGEQAALAAHLAEFRDRLTTLPKMEAADV